MTHLAKRSLVLTSLLTLMLAACGSDTAATTAINAHRTVASTVSAATSSTPTIATPTTPTTSEQPTTAPTTDGPATTEPATTEPSLAGAPTTPASTTTALTLPSVTYTVSGVVDGDTVNIAASDGNSLRVRVIGIDAPESGACEATLATETMTKLADGKAVTLLTGGDGEDADKYGRLLRYIDIDGNDAGLTMINMGLAKARYDSRDGYGRHAREDS
ncbi:MAG: nuclease (SNase protein), partial [Ilumatobacteraceae bacterium]|nr:nuclease (SNase protein) [Ilumatobacteraceae bacterium]